MLKLKIENLNKKKIIICSGCSFTNTFIQNPPLTNLNSDKNKWYWVDWLQESLGDNYLVLNVGNQTNDNTSITNIVLHTINDLLKLGVSSDNIQLAIQWTNPFRMSFYVETDKPKTGVHTVNFIDTDKKGFWYLTGGYNDTNILSDVIPTEFLRTYLPFYNNKVNSYNRFFKDVLLLQSYCKLNDIKWISFFMNDSFTQNYYELGNTYQKVDKKFSIGEDLLVKKNLHNNTQQKCIWDENDNLSYLKEMIDFNNFWFYEADDFKFGGMYEWTIRNYDREVLSKYKQIGLDYTIFTETMGETELSFEQEIEKVNQNRHRFGHTSAIMAKYFVDSVLKKLI
jgi:hypothetical protein